MSRMGAIRKALATDIKRIHALINACAQEQEMLPRSLNELYEHIRDMYVYEDASGGTASQGIKGVCALHIVWEDLAEIRSLAVIKEARGAGVGTSLASTCIEEARGLGVRQVFALTYAPEFFKRLGFEVVDKSKLPHKIWGDCIRCPKFPDCNEYAVMRRLE